MSEHDDESNTGKVTEFRNVKFNKAWVRRMRAQGGLGPRGEEVVSRIERGEPMSEVAMWYTVEIIKNNVPWSQLSPFEQDFHHQMQQGFERWRKTKNDAATD